MIFGKRTLPGNSSGNRILFPKLNVLKILSVSSSKKIPTAINSNVLVYRIVPALSFY